MIEAVSRQNHLSDPRLAALATSAAPAWLWNTDASRVLWANPIGTAILGRPSPAAPMSDQHKNLARIGGQITRFSATLPHSGAARLQRLRGLGAGLGGMLLCNCSRITLPERTPGFLIVALEPAGPPLTLAERVRRLFQSCEAAVAVFAPDGSPIYVTARAREVLEVSNLAALGAEAIGREALILGNAVSSTPHGVVSIDRLGRDTSTVLVATFLTAPRIARPTEAAAQPNETVSSAPILTVEPKPATSSPPLSAELPAEQPATVADTAPPHEIPSDEIPSDEDPSHEGPSSEIPSVEIPILEIPSLELLPSAWTSEPVSPQPPPRSTAPVQSVKPDVPLRERRHPLRFVWQMDVDGGFTLGSDEFTEVIGPNTAMAFGRRWDEIAADLALDPEGNVARAIASRDTWSGVTVSWPVDGGDDRLKIELSGLPIYDRNRIFLGYRGFGVCRDTERVAELAYLRRHASAAIDHGSLDMPELEIISPAAAKTATGANDDNRPVFTVVPTARNVVPFRTATSGADQKSPALSPSEHNAFSELARQLTARLQEGVDDANASARQDTPAAEPMPAASEVAATPETGEVRHAPDHAAFGPTDRPLLERLPVGILVYRLDHLLYANRAFLEWTGYPSLDALTDAGGLDSLFIEPGTGSLTETTSDGKTLRIVTHRGDTIPVEGRLFSAPWDGETAIVLTLVNTATDDRHQKTERALRAAEIEIGTLNAILDAATEAMIVLDRDGRLLSANRGAKVLLAYETNELKGSFSELFIHESRRVVLDHLCELAHAETPVVVSTQCEVTARTSTGGSVPVLLQMSRIAGDDQKFCAVLQDITTRKRIAEELLSAQKHGEKASADKSEFLAKVSHEIRTPLNSIVGFSEVMLEERFGPIGNERYRDYLKDIRTSGTHVVSMLNDLLDLTKIEAGTLELTAVHTNLNELVHGCVSQMQPQASRERIIIRMSLAPSLPAVVADVRSLRQIIVNLLNNSIKFTGAGGQVIVSTALSDAREIVLRVRDTGIGMSFKDVEAALEPFRQRTTRSSWNASGSGLGLSLTKALAEANGARFNIASKVDDGTLVEITFSPAPAVTDRETH
jgi:PAS domain S-box-containing protein